MFSCVSDERRRDRERHAAQIALVRFLSGVSSLVIGQRAGLSESLTADVTDVRFLPAVQSVVHTHTQKQVNKSVHNDTTRHLYSHTISLT